MNHIIKLLSCIFIFSYIQLAYANNEEENLKAYINSLIINGYNIINDKSLTDNKKNELSNRLIHNNLHLDWMAEHTLGHHKKNLSAKKIKEFTEIYSRFIIQTYTNILRNYTAIEVVIKTVNKINNSTFIVDVEIFKQDSNLPIRVEYLVHKVANNSKNAYNIGDIIMEGISILNSQQVEFDSILSKGGIDSLITNLKRKL